MVLGNAAASEQTGVAAVSGLRIDLHVENVTRMAWSGKCRLNR
jgi:hypothetical protein